MLKGKETILFVLPLRCCSKTASCFIANKTPPQLMENLHTLTLSIGYLCDTVDSEPKVSLQHISGTVMLAGELAKPASSPSLLVTYKST